VHTLPPNIELGGDKDTKQNWDPALFDPVKGNEDTNDDSDDPDIVHTGHQFGSMLNLETKGPILDGVKAPDQGKGGKGKGKGKGPKGNKKDSDDSESEPDSSDDEEKVEEPKKKKKQKESKKSKGGKKKKSKDEDGEPVIEPGCNEDTLRKTYNLDNGMNVTVQKKKKRTNFEITCDNGLNPNFNFVTCKDKKGTIGFERFSVDIGRKKKKNKKRTNEIDIGEQNIFCSQFGGTKNTEQCTSLKYAKKAARKFDLTPKEGFFYNYSEHSHKWEVTVACNQKYTTEPPQSGVLLLECTGFPKLIKYGDKMIETYWYPSLTSVTNFETFRC